jgi:hypothetical protein
MRLRRRVGTGSNADVQHRWNIKNITNYKTVSYFSYSILYQFNKKKSEEKIALAFLLTFACFKKDGLVLYLVGWSRSRSRIKIFTRSRMMRLCNADLKCHARLLKKTSVKYS